MIALHSVWWCPECDNVWHYDDTPGGESHISHWQNDNTEVWCLGTLVDLVAVYEAAKDLLDYDHGYSPASHIDPARCAFCLSSRSGSHSEACKWGRLKYAIPHQCLLAAMEADR